MSKTILPAIAMCAMQSTWADAYTLLMSYTEDVRDQMPLAVAMAAGAAGSRAEGPGAGDWDMKRRMARAIADALAAADHQLLSHGWWLLSLDPRSKADINEGRRALVLTAAAFSDPLLDETARAWCSLADAQGGELDADPIAAAHRLKKVPTSQSTTEEAAVLEGLAFLVGSQTTYKEAKRVAIFAAVEMLDTIEYSGSLRVALQEMGAMDDPITCAKKVGAFIPEFAAAVRARPLFGDTQLNHMLDALIVLAAHPDEPKLVRRAGYVLMRSAEQAVHIGITPVRRAQAIVSAWNMSARFEWPIGKPTRPPDEIDLFAAAHRISGDLLANMTDPSPIMDPDPLGDEGPEDETNTGSVIVLPEVGGISTTNSAKEAATAFRALAGISLPRIRLPDLEVVRARLRSEFPHFVLQIETILADLAGREYVKLSPFLLVSGPGAGKTRFARRLAEHLYVPVHRYDAAGASDNVFSGTGRRWASGEPCVPLEAVRITGAANPFVLVDEIDKAGTSNKNGSLSAAMLPFLEVETSARYPDPYALANCDLSHVSYIATANDSGAIPAVLRDRFRMLQLPLPGGQHLPELARSIIADIAVTNGGDPRWYPDLMEDELQIAWRLWPGGSVRRLRAVVERLVARREQRKH
jgi:hypothetical protein